MQQAAWLLARWYFSSLLGRAEHKIVRKTQVGWLCGQQRKEVSPGAGGWITAAKRGGASLVEKGCLTKPTRAGFQRAPFSASPQRAVQIREGLSGSPGGARDSRAGAGPCLGLPSTLPYFVKLSSPHPRPVECSSQSFIAHMPEPLCNKRK